MNLVGGLLLDFVRWLVQMTLLSKTTVHGSPFRLPRITTSALAPQGLVWSTWAVQAGCIIGLALVYNMFPDYKSVRSWEARWSLWATCCFCCLSSAERKRREALAERLGRIFSLVREGCLRELCGCVKVPCSGGTHL